MAASRIYAISAGFFFAACAGPATSLRRDAPAPAPPVSVAQPRKSELPAEPVAAASAPDFGADLAHRAAALVGISSLRKVSHGVPDDCTGLVRLVYRSEGIHLSGSTADIFRAAQQVGAIKRSDPRPGDLIFFRNTYDKNRDGRRNDGLTHVGIVESADADGNIAFIHRGHRGVARSHLSLQRPRLHRDANGQIVNDFLQRSGKTSKPRLTGELFAGFGSAKALRGNP